MRELSKTAVQPSNKRRMVGIAAAVLSAVVLCQPNLALARGGGGGGHGGGFHAGGFHAGGFHAGGFGGFHGGFAGSHPATFRSGFHGGAFGHGLAGGRVGAHWYHGWHSGRFGWWLAAPGLAWTYYDDPWFGYYGDDYGNYSQSYAGQTWYYCSDPAGYYPYVTQCSAGWETVPAS
jgi:hypothetical protein